jgi:hypothetical protein
MASDLALLALVKKMDGFTGPQGPAGAPGQNKARLDRLGHKDRKGLPVKTDATANPELLDRKAHKVQKDRKALQERLALTVRTV